MSDRCVFARCTSGGETAAGVAIEAALREFHTRASELLEHRSLSRTDPAVTVGEFRIRAGVARQYCKTSLRVGRNTAADRTLPQKIGHLLEPAERRVAADGRPATIGESPTDAVEKAPSDVGMLDAPDLVPKRHREILEIIAAGEAALGREPIAVCRSTTPSADRWVSRNAFHEAAFNQPIQPETNGRRRNAKGA